MHSLHQYSLSRETIRIYAPPRRLEMHRLGDSPAELSTVGRQLSQRHLLLSVGEDDVAVCYLVLGV